jgi:hypothetical protein
VNPDKPPPVHSPAMTALLPINVPIKTNKIVLKIKTITDKKIFNF